MMSRRMTVRAAAALALGFALMPAGDAAAQSAGDPIKVGELFSYARIPAFAVPYRNGWQMAVDEVNAAGGVLGRKLEIVSRDDGGTPTDAVRVAEELVSREKVAFLMGTFLSNIGLAVSDFAKQKQVMFLATEPLTDALTMASGNRYTFRLRPNTYMQTKMLVEAAAKSGKTRWAIVAPNYEYGQSAAANFKALMKQYLPGAQVVVEQYPALGKIDAGATVQAVLAANPDAIFNVTFGADLIKFVREATDRGLLKDRYVLSLLTGEPEYLEPLKEDAPVGWVVTGYPWYDINTPDHTRFVEAYKARFKENPKLGSLLGYQAVKVVRGAISAAGSTDTEKLLAAMRTVTVFTPTGPISMRAIDQQSTMGAWVGTIALKDKQGVMVNWKYANGKDYMFSEDEVMKARPSN